MSLSATLQSLKPSSLNQPPVEGRMIYLLCALPSWCAMCSKGPGCARRGSKLRLLKLGWSMMRKEKNLSRCLVSWPFIYLFRSHKVTSGILLWGQLGWENVTKITQWVGIWTWANQILALIFNHCLMLADNYVTIVWIKFKHQTIRPRIERSVKLVLPEVSLKKIQTISSDPNKQTLPFSLKVGRFHGSVEEPLFYMQTVSGSVSSISGYKDWAVQDGNDPGESLSIWLDSSD